MKKSHLELYTSLKTQREHGLMYSKSGKDLFDIELENRKKEYKITV